MNELNELGDVIAEGKTKRIYANNFNQTLAFMEFKDDITAGDGEKHDIMFGKSIIDFDTNQNIFHFLNRKDIPTAYMSSLGNKDYPYVIIKRLEMIRLEVVSRRIATGSLLKRTSFEQGSYFDPLMMEFFFKNDALHDPLMSEEELIRDGYEKKDIELMKQINERVFILLENAFRLKGGLQLIDFKLEYGRGQDNRIYLGDEITAGSMRVWPLRNERIYPTAAHTPEQIMNEILDKSRQLDKQIYREGGSEREVITGFERIRDITSRF